MIFIVGVVALALIFAFIVTARAGWNLRDLPLAHRWDLVGWALLDLQLGLTVCYLLYINRMDLVFPALAISIIATLKLPSVRRRVILDGAATSAAQSSKEKSR